MGELALIIAAFFAGVAVGALGLILVMTAGHDDDQGAWGDDDE